MVTFLMGCQILVTIVLIIMVLGLRRIIAEDHRQRQLDANRREVEQVMIAALLTRADNIIQNCRDWYHTYTGQVWVEPPRNAVSKQIQAIEKAVKSFTQDEEE